MRADLIAQSEGRAMRKVCAKRGDQAIFDAHEMIDDIDSRPAGVNRPVVNRLGRPRREAL
jgi:hypothetical protein